MKFGQLIEYIMTSIFLEKSYTRYVGELFPGTFLKSRNWAYLWINSQFHIVCFFCMKLRTIKNKKRSATNFSTQHFFTHNFQQYSIKDALNERFYIIINVNVNLPDAGTPVSFCGFIWIRKSWQIHKTLQKCEFSISIWRMKRAFIMK